MDQQCMEDSFMEGGVLGQLLSSMCHRHMINARQLILSDARSTLQPMPPLRSLSEANHYPIASSSSPNSAPNPMPLADRLRAILNKAPPTTTNPTPLVSSPPPQQQSRPSGSSPPPTLKPTLTLAAATTIPTTNYYSFNHKGNGFNGLTSKKEKRDSLPSDLQLPPPEPLGESPAKSFPEPTNTAPLVITKNTISTAPTLNTTVNTIATPSILIGSSSSTTPTFSAAHSTPHSGARLSGSENSMPSVMASIQTRLATHTAVGQVLSTSLLELNTFSKSSTVPAAPKAEKLGKKSTPPYRAPPQVAVTECRSSELGSTTPTMPSASATASGMMVPSLLSSPKLLTPQVNSGEVSAASAKVSVGDIGVVASSNATPTSSNVAALRGTSSFMGASRSLPAFSPIVSGLLPSPDGQDVTTPLSASQRRGYLGVSSTLVSSMVPEGGLSMLQVGSGTDSMNVGILSAKSDAGHTASPFSPRPAHHEEDEGAFHDQLHGYTFPLNTPIRKVTTPKGLALALYEEGSAPIETRVAEAVGMLRRMKALDGLVHPSKHSPLGAAVDASDSSSSVTIESFTEYLAILLREAVKAQPFNRRSKGDRWLLHASLMQPTLLDEKRLPAVHQFIDHCELDRMRQARLDEESADCVWLARIPFHRQSQEKMGASHPTTSSIFAAAGASSSFSPPTVRGLRDEHLSSIPSFPDRSEDHSISKPQADLSTLNTSSTQVVVVAQASSSTNPKGPRASHSYMSRETDEAATPLRQAAPDPQQGLDDPAQPEAAFANLPLAHHIAPSSREREVSSQSLSTSLNSIKPDRSKTDLTQFASKDSLRKSSLSRFTPRVQIIPNRSAMASVPTSGYDMPTASGPNPQLPVSMFEFARTWSASSRRTPAPAAVGDQSHWASVVSAQTFVDSPTLRSSNFHHLPNVSLNSAPHSTGSLPIKTSSSCTSPTEIGEAVGEGSFWVRGASNRSSWQKSMEQPKASSNDLVSQLSDSRAGSFGWDLSHSPSQARTHVSPTNYSTPLHIVNGARINHLSDGAKTSPYPLPETSVSDDVEAKRASSSSLAVSAHYPSQLSDAPSQHHLDIEILSSPLRQVSGPTTQGAFASYVHPDVPNDVSLTIGTSSSSEGKRNHVGMQTSLTAVRRSHESFKRGEGLSSFASSTNASHQQMMVASSSTYSTGTSRSAARGGSGNTNPRSTPSSNQTESASLCTNHIGHFPFSQSPRRSVDLTRPLQGSSSNLNRDVHTQTEAEALVPEEGISRVEELLSPLTTTGELSHFLGPEHSEGLSGAAGNAAPFSLSSSMLRTGEHTLAPEGLLAKQVAFGDFGGTVGADRSRSTSRGTSRASRRQNHQAESSLCTVSALSLNLIPPDGNIEIPSFSGGAMSPPAQPPGDWAPVSVTSSFKKGPLSSNESNSCTEKSTPTSKVVKHVVHPTGETSRYSQTSTTGHHFSFRHLQGSASGSGGSSNREWVSAHSSDPEDQAIRSGGVSLTTETATTATQSSSPHPVGR